MFFASTSPACAIVIALTQTAEASSARAMTPSEPFITGFVDVLMNTSVFLHGCDDRFHRMTVLSEERMLTH
jgi:hypothetical protein